jgi:hypothetical protein
MAGFDLGHIFIGTMLIELLARGGSARASMPKGSPDKPPSVTQVEMNHLKRKVRVGIEHNFGRMKLCLRGLPIWGIYFVRNRSEVG